MFRNHLLKIHSIELEAPEHPVKRQRGRLIQDAFAKAGDTRRKAALGQEDASRSAVNLEAAREALVHLVTVRNPSYNCSSWPELHALISAINPAAGGVISLYTETRREYLQHIDPSEHVCPNRWK